MLHGVCFHRRFYQSEVSHQKGAFEIGAQEFLRRQSRTSIFHGASCNLWLGCMWDFPDLTEFVWSLYWFCFHDYCLFWERAQHLIHSEHDFFYFDHDTKGFIFLHHFQSTLQPQKEIQKRPSTQQKLASFICLRWWFPKKNDIQGIHLFRVPLTSFVRWLH